MRIEVLNTGSELLLGTTLNTHGAWIGTELFGLGLRVARQTTVPDGPAIRDALAEAVGRSDAVLVTGGLGPTSDDITREAAAEVLGRELMIDEAALRSIEGFFDRLGRPMAPSNRKQAMVPVGADVLPNPNGTAPGLYLPPRINAGADCAVFLLPGPPRELRPMFESEVVPRLRALAGVEAAGSMRLLKLTGVGESDLEHRVDAELAAIEGLEHGYCSRTSEVDVRLVGSIEVIERGARVIHDAFAGEVFSEDGASLEEAVVRLLEARGLQLATAESCTGGLIANRITDVAGSSRVFRQGYVTYANESKVELLGVDAATLAEQGAVSEAVARQMAEGALRNAGTDLAVAVTGIAGPDGGSEDKPVGTVFLALARRGGETLAFKRFLPRDRRSFKWSVSQAALDLVRRAASKGAEPAAG